MLERLGHRRRWSAVGSSAPWWNCLTAHTCLKLQPQLKSGLGEGVGNWASLFADLPNVTTLNMSAFHYLALPLAPWGWCLPGPLITRRDGFDFQRLQCLHGVQGRLID